MIRDRTVARARVAIFLETRRLLASYIRWLISFARGSARRRLCVFFLSLSLSRCFLRVGERMGILVSFCADRETMGNKSSAPAASDIAADGVLLFRFRRSRGGGKLSE